MAASCLHEPKFLHLPVDHLIVYSSTWCAGGGGFIPSFLLFALWWFLLFSPQTCTVSTCVLPPTLFSTHRSSCITVQRCIARPHKAEPGQSSPDGYGRWTCSRVCVRCCWKLLKIFSFPPWAFEKVDIHTTTRSQLCVGVDDISDSEGRGTVVTWGQPTIWLYFSTTPLSI